MRTTAFVFGVLLAGACGSASPDGGVDAEPGDGAVPDAGPFGSDGGSDSGTLDAGALDGGALDGGGADATSDAAASDAGRDARAIDGATPDSVDLTLSLEVLDGAGRAATSFAVDDSIRWRIRLTNLGAVRSELASVLVDVTAGFTATGSIGFICTPLPGSTFNCGSVSNLSFGESLQIDIVGRALAAGTWDFEAEAFTSVPATELDVSNNRVTARLTVTP